MGVRMLLALLLCSLVLVSAVGQQANYDWVDPYDMLHNDSTSKTMRKTTEPTHFDNVATKRREYTEDTSQVKMVTFPNQVVDLQLKAPDSSDAFYEAKVGVSKQAITEIQKLQDGDGSFTTGALEPAVFQIPVNLTPQDNEARKWRFEDSFGVELDTLINILLCVLVMSAIISTPLWAIVSCIMQLFGVCLVVSFFWNLYHGQM